MHISLFLFNRRPKIMHIIAAHQLDERRPYKVYMVYEKSPLLRRKKKQFERASDALIYIEFLQKEGHIINELDATLNLFRADAAKES